RVVAGDAVESAAGRLYGLPLEEFTKARDEHARVLRKDGDRAGADAVKALRKPSKAAWAINQVVRGQPDDVDALLAAGDRVRDSKLDRLRAEADRARDRAELLAEEVATAEARAADLRRRADEAAERATAAARAVDDAERSTAHD